jgi:hypothetical protein
VAQKSIDRFPIGIFPNFFSIKIDFNNKSICSPRYVLTHWYQFANSDNVISWQTILWECLVAKTCRNFRGTAAALRKLRSEAHSSKGGTQARQQYPRRGPRWLAQGPKTRTLRTYTCVEQGISCFLGALTVRTHHCLARWVAVDRLAYGARKTACRGAC